MQNRIVFHLFKNREDKYNTACGRFEELIFNDIKKVTCKKCIGSIQTEIKNRKKRHLLINENEKEFLNFHNLCHTIEGKGTHCIEQVTCKKCIYKINKSLLCQ